MISVQICAEKGASSEGFRIMVQPTARAGATLQAIWLAGQFHGVMNPHTPMGSFTIKVEPRSSWKWYCLSTPSAVCKWPTPIAAWALVARAAGAPISSVMAAAMSA